MVVGEAPWHTVKGTYMHTNYRLYPVLRVCKVSSSSNSSSINPSTTLSTVSFGHNRLEVRVGVLCSCNKLSRQAFSSSEGARTKLSVVALALPIHAPHFRHLLSAETIWHDGLLHAVVRMR